LNTYAQRTCSKCGIRKPSNNMYSKTIDKIYSGSSRRSVNIFTFFGYLLGNKGSDRAIQQWMFQSTNRKYSGGTTKEIYLCLKCYHLVPRANSGKGIFKIIFFPFYFPYIVLRFVITSPVTKVVLLSIVSILIWVSLKFLKFLKFIGIKIIDQDGDGDIDGKDFQLAYQKAANLFSNSK